MCGCAAGTMAVAPSRATGAVAAGGAQDIFQRAINESLAAGEVGIQMAVYKAGRLVVDVWGGVADPRTGRKVDGETLYNVFSGTKAVLSTALNLQAERKLIEYDKPIAYYWPAFAANGKGKATVEHALSHRAGVPYMPTGSTAQSIVDYQSTVAQIAAMKPASEPGTNAYHATTYGWIIAELVRRTDPGHRPIRQFVLEEVWTPLGITDFWIGVSDSALSRVAPLQMSTPPPPLGPPDSPGRLAIPDALRRIPEIWNSDDLRRAVIPSIGGICNARSCARFWAMLANGGQLDGAVLFSPHSVRSFSQPRPSGPDLVYGNIKVGMRGYWLAQPPAVGSSPRMLTYPGSGGHIGWADPDNNLAVAVCHNDMGTAFYAPLARAVRDAFGVM